MYRVFSSCVLLNFRLILLAVDVLHLGISSKIQHFDLQRAAKILWKPLSDHRSNTSFSVYEGKSETEKVACSAFSLKIMQTVIILDFCDNFD